MNDRKKNLTAAVIVIGNEILSGKVKESNAVFFAEELRKLGVALRSIVTVPDEEGPIVEALRREKERWDIVFTSGGVGPTHDDITIECIAKAFETPLEENARFVDLLRKSYGDKLNDHLMKMAMVPKGARFIEHPDLFVPVMAIENVYIFPGEPNLLRRKFNAIKDRFAGAPFFLKKIFTQMDEGELAGAMIEAEGKYGVAIGSYPVYNNPEYQVQITIESQDAAVLEQAFEFLSGHIRPETLVRIE